jgi:hypothetical protein
MEQEKRGVYAGAVGRFDFNSNELDTCIAIRTMTFKDGVAYLQSGEPHLPRGYVASAPNAHYGRKGGGIVFDSIEEDEYVETINKLGANVRCIDAAEGTSIRPRAEDGETSVEGLVITAHVTLLAMHALMNSITIHSTPAKSHSRERQGAGAYNLSGCFPLAYQEDCKSRPPPMTRARLQQEHAAALPSHSFFHHPACHCSLLPVSRD